MQLEAIGRVTMCDLGLEVGRKVDDVDGTEWTFLGTDTATNTQTLGNEGDFGFGGHFNTQLACAHHGTGLFAFLTTFLL